MAATGPPIAAPPPPLSYTAHYAQLTDVLQGNYAPLFAIHDPVTGQPSNAIYETVIDATDTIPKVVLALVATSAGTYYVIAIHNPWHFKPSIIAATSQWDGQTQTFAFIGDVHPTSRVIHKVLVPNGIFDTVQEQRVHATNYITTAFVATPNTLLLLNPVADGIPDTELVTITIVAIGRRDTFANAVITDNNEASCSLFLNRLHVAVTKWFDIDGLTITVPANHLGLIDTAFSPIVDDHQWAECRWSVIACDLPALDTTNLATSPTGTNTHYKQILSVLCSEHAADPAANKACRLADKQDKLPSETKWHYAAAHWIQFTGCSSKLDLPPVNHRLVNSKNKANHLLILCKAMASRACNCGAATSQIPVVSIETKEMVMSGNFGVPTHDHNVLALGMQPFAVVLYLGNELRKAVELWANNYNLMLAGQADPTINEQAAFPPKEVCFPQDPITAGLMLGTTSIQVNVFMGVTLFFASTFRKFCCNQWPRVQTTLYLASQYNPSAATSLIP